MFFYFLFFHSISQVSRFDIVSGILKAIKSNSKHVFYLFNMEIFIQFLSRTALIMGITNIHCSLYIYFMERNPLGWPHWYFCRFHHSANSK